MEWYQYLSGFWAGAFLANFIPHFVKGICGDRFPTPFAKPPGKGLSSPTVNVLWSLFNLFIAVILIRAGRAYILDERSLIMGFIGFGLLSLLMSRRFAQKHPE